MLCIFYASKQKKYYSRFGQEKNVISIVILNYLLYINNITFAGLVFGQCVILFRLFFCPPYIRNMNKALKSLKTYSFTVNHVMDT